MTGVTPAWMLIPPTKHCGVQGIVRFNNADPCYVCVKCHTIYAYVYERERLFGQIPSKNLCDKCGRPINADTHSYSDLGGYECYPIPTE